VMNTKNTASPKKEKEEPMNLKVGKKRFTLPAVCGGGSILRIDFRHVIGEVVKNDVLSALLKFEKIIVKLIK